MTYKDILAEWDKPLKEHTFWTIHSRKLTAYEKRQALARDLAIEWQSDLWEQGSDWYDIWRVQDFFYEVGKKYGLLREFRENGIC